jgi:hypothetical protein
MPAGRPPAFTKAEDMQKLIDEYFEYIKGEPDETVGGKSDWKRPPEPITITGVCLYLGFESRQSFYAYEKIPEFSYTVKRARMLIENAYEQRLVGQNVTGSIFALKNLGWEDRQKSELSGGLDINKKPSWFDEAETK